jgi:signal transduction histidine kinase
MNVPSSLRGRIFLASALLAALPAAMAVYFVNGQVTRETEHELQRQLLAAGALAEQLRTTRTETLTVMARLIADLPKFKAAVETNDPPTVDDIAIDYQRQLHSNLLRVTNRSGAVLAAIGNQPAAMPRLDLPVGREAVDLLAADNGLLQVVTVPVTLDVPEPQLLGTLTVGFLLDDALAEQLKAITDCDIAFAMGGRVVAATLPPEARPRVASLLSTTGIAHVSLGSEQYVVLLQSLSAAQAPESIESGPALLMLRSRTEQLRFLHAIHTGLAATTIVTVCLAVVLSFAVARTITRPLAYITDGMREVAATGDLTRKIVPRGRRWEDEDARLLAATFNTLTDSIARFQREISQKERLSSLGRLSTVIAHEIRNPLMIIKASVHSLGRGNVTADVVHEAAADINEEVGRLNDIVNNVLDFARPIAFRLAPTDVNDVCRESAEASTASPGAVPVHLELDPSLPTIVTDAERLRAAVVNILLNAQQAVAGLNAPAGAAGSVALRTNAPATELPFVELRTRALDPHIDIVVADRGFGIDPANLSRLFEPFFTTKRGGTGLGLAVTKSIIEGLGGTIAVTTRQDRGTEVHVHLPIGGSASHPSI